MTTKQRNNLRASVASAFRQMARGTGAREAYASTVWFYRSGGQEWTRQLRTGSGRREAAA
jgi:hypothetical protein